MKTAKVRSFGYPHSLHVHAAGKALILTVASKSHLCPASQTFQTSLRWSKVVGVQTMQGRVLPTRAPDKGKKK